MTSTGWGALVGGAVLVAVGYAFGYGEAAALGAVCLLAVVGAVLWAVPAPVLRVERVVPGRVRRGDPAEAVVVLGNTGTRTRRGLRVVERDVVVEVPALRGGAAHEVRYALPTGRRGRVEVGPVRVERGDPLGLVRRTRVYGGSERLLVRPRVRELAVLAGGRVRHGEGPVSGGADDGAAFHALRAYVLGDDLRRVHWRSTARTGTLMVRQTADVPLPLTTLVLDTRRASYGSAEEFEVAVECAASVAYAAARSRFPVRVVSEAGVVLAGGGDGEAVLDALAVVRWSRAGGGASFEGLERHRGGGVLVVVTGAEGGGSGGVARLRGRFDRVSVVCVGGGGARVGGEVGEVRVSSVDELAVVWRREVAG
ncbi:DUF58 domain-containing protein [Streptomyces roseirectus]|uniref:DUF58 domain-containing protein n=1 Tax=Streptomyces roseirectus TaxID=2768066 RepID=A0A7H0ISS4_9ACTN|nr:DUF58 domain-containing protein [Streptomyces roseirectus]